jgi:hypothetical protein
MAITINGLTGITFPAGGVGNPVGAVVGTTDTQTLTNKTISGLISSATISMLAGTSTVAPLTFNAGTNLNTASIGAIEFDGKLPYFTPQGTQRGVIPAAQYYRLNTANAGGNITGAQSVFGVGVTLSASTVYAFEGFYMLLKTAGTTGHTVSYGFGGTATVNNAAFGGLSFTSVSSSAPLNTNVFSGFTQSLASTAYTTSLASAAIYTTIRFWGTVSVNASGTFTPQYTLSAQPGGAYTVQIGSYINIYPVGASGANISVGAWA